MSSFQIESPDFEESHSSLYSDILQLKWYMITAAQCPDLFTLIVEV